MFKQIAFTTYIDDDEEEIFGGIGEYEEINGEEVLQRVICGCCGGTFEPKEVVIKHVFNHWINLGDEILGDWTP